MNITLEKEAIYKDTGKALRQKIKYHTKDVYIWTTIRKVIFIVGIRTVGVDTDHYQNVAKLRQKISIIELTAFLIQYDIARNN